MRQPMRAHLAPRFNTPAARPTTSPSRDGKKVVPSLFPDLSDEDLLSGKAPLKRKYDADVEMRRRGIKG